MSEGRGSGAMISFFLHVSDRTGDMPAFETSPPAPRGDLGNLHPGGFQGIFPCTPGGPACPRSPGDLPAYPKRPKGEMIVEDQWC